MKLRGTGTILSFFLFSAGALFPCRAGAEQDGPAQRCDVVLPATVKESGLLSLSACVCAGPAQRSPIEHDIGVCSLRGARGVSLVCGVSREAGPAVARDAQT